MRALARISIYTVKPNSSWSKNFSNHFFLQFFFEFPGYGRTSRQWSERNVDSRPKTQLNGAEAPFIFCPETQSWCLIKQKLNISFGKSPRSATIPRGGGGRERKVFTPRTESGSKCFWQGINSRILSQLFVRAFFGRDPELGGT